MTAWETYLETAAAADAVAWFDSLHDDAKVEVFIMEGPAADRFERWLRDKVTAAAEDRAAADRQDRA